MLLELFENGLGNQRIDCLCVCLSLCVLQGVTIVKGYLQGSQFLPALHLLICKSILSLLTVTLFNVTGTEKYKLCDIKK